MSLNSGPKLEIVLPKFIKLCNAVGNAQSRVNTCRCTFSGYYGKECKRMYTWGCVAGPGHNFSRERVVLRGVTVATVLW